MKAETERTLSLMKMKDLVYEILIVDPQSRRSDRRLINIYYGLRYPQVVRGRTFSDVMERTDLESFESIGRVRRKLQEEHPELRPAEEVQEMRKENEAFWKEWSRT
jgi:hypothetical protein